MNSKGVREDSFEYLSYAVYFSAGEGFHEFHYYCTIVGKDELVVWLTLVNFRNSRVKGALGGYLVLVGSDFREEGVFISGVLKGVGTCA